MSQLACVTPELLVWARKTGGFTIKQVVKKLDLKRVTAEVLCSWEEGKAQPTYRQLEKLAYDVYRRPIALFFFPTPPAEPSSQESFRTLTSEITDSLSPNMHFLLRRAQAFKISIAELAETGNPSDRFLPGEIPLELGSHVAKVASSVREFLGVSLEQQSGWEDTTMALKQWRKRVESGGVFIFKDSFKEDNVSGFSLHDEAFPLIYINNNMSPTRQIFTLFHALAHIMFKIGGIDFGGIDFRQNKYIEKLKGDNKQIEIICNKFAGEFLVPGSDFTEKSKNVKKLRDDALEKEISTIANYYKVSREVILRRCLDHNLVSQNIYNKFADKWSKLFEKAYKKAAKGGGNWYATQNTYRSHAFLELAFRKYYRHQITIDQLSEHIDIKTKNIEKFESTFLKSIGESI